MTWVPALVWTSSPNFEVGGAPTAAIWALGTGLVVFRAAHALGMRPDSLANPLRGLGAGGTTLVILVASVWGIVLAV